MLQNLNQMYNNKLASIANSFAGSLSNNSQSGLNLSTNSTKDLNSKINQYYKRAGQKINFLA